MRLTIAPTNSLSKSLVGIAWLVASSATFRALTGASSVQDAFDNYVHSEADDTDDTVATRPRVIVDFARQYGDSKLSLNAYSVEGQLLLSFEFPPTSELTAVPDQKIEFCNRVDGIKDDMELIQGQGAGYVAGETHWPISRFTLLDGPGKVVETKAVGGREQRTVFYGATYLIEWRN